MTPPTDAISKASAALNRAQDRFDNHRGWGPTVDLLGARVDAAAQVEVEGGAKKVKKLRAQGLTSSRAGSTCK